MGGDEIRGALPVLAQEGFPRYLTEPLDTGHLIVAGSLLGGGILLGWIVYRLVLGKLRRTGTLTSWGGADIAVAAIHQVTLIWFTVAGTWAASAALPLRDNVANWTQRGLIAIIILSATIVSARLSGDLVRLYALRSEGALRSSTIFINITRLGVILIGILVLLQTLGVSIAPMLTAMGIGGLAVALALQRPLANLFAGLQMIGSKQLRTGDYVRLDSGEEGYVVDMTWRNTSIRQLPNNIILVPNERLAGAIITNYHQPEPEMSVLVQVGVSYDSDLPAVERATIDAAQWVQENVPGAVRDHEPFIRYHTFNDFSIDFSVILRAREFVDQFAIKHEFVKRLHERYREEGIEIPFPIRTVIMGDGTPEGPPARVPLPRARPDLRAGRPGGGR